MSVTEFTKEIDECETADAVHRFFHAHYPALVGTHRELMQAMEHADARLVTLADCNPVTRGTAVIPELAGAV